MCSRFSVFVRLVLTEVHALAAELRPLVGRSARDEGTWSTLYLSTEGLLQARAPWLRERLVGAALRVHDTTTPLDPA